MKSSIPDKDKSNDRVVFISAIACFVVGIIGAVIFKKDPFISWLFLPGLIYAGAIIWGLYLGLTYKHDKQ